MLPYQQDRTGHGFHLVTKLAKPQTYFDHQVNFEMDAQSQSSMASIGAECSAEFLLFSHEFPSDDVQELFRGLHRHSKGRKFPLLAAFLTECDHTLREEISKLPNQLQEQMPPIQTVNSLASRFDDLRKGPLGGAWEGAFLCIYQIAMLLG